MEEVEEEEEEEVERIREDNVCKIRNTFGKPVRHQHPVSCLHYHTFFSSIYQKLVGRRYGEEERRGRG